jgi:hypothetical protein
MAAYIFFCILIGLINKFRGWKFFPAFLLSVFTTPVIGTIFTIIRGPNNYVNEDDYYEEEKECPECAEYVKMKAKICRFCGYSFV